MADSAFKVSEYTIPASHVREYYGGARSHAAASKLRLAVKRYTPRHQNPLPNAVTIVGTHANGAPKEVYEPLWQLILQNLPRGTIRGIWIADCVHQGASAVLNEGLLGDDPSWFDHAHDLLGLINRFADKMTVPIIGVGHSLGCVQLLRLASFHSRLLCGIALVEPVVQERAPPGPNVAMASSRRRDWWPSRAEAEKSFSTNKFFRSWNPDMFRLFLQHGLRETPTATHPKRGGVTLATSKAQEAWTFVRGNFTEVGDDESERKALPGAVDGEIRQHIFSRPEMVQMNRELASVRPDVLFVFGDRSPMNPSALRKDKLNRTGTGLGGNGGAAARHVEAVTVKNGGHMLPMEHTEEVAATLARWIGRQVDEFARTETWHHNHDRRVSERDKLVLSKEWMMNVSQKVETPRNTRMKL